MKFACELLLTVLLSLLSSAAIAEDTLGLILGVEQWDDGKKSEHFVQQWNLRCTGSGPTARCRLKRTTFIDCFGDQTTVSISEMSSEDGRLRVRKLDREAGRLEFSLLYRGGGLFETDQEETSECVLTFNPLYNGAIDRSLLCRMVHRDTSGSVSVLEDRLPRFSSTWKPKCGFWMPGEDRIDDSRLLALLQEALVPDKQQATAIYKCLQKEEMTPPSEKEWFEGFPLFNDVMESKIPITDAIEAQFAQWVKGFPEHFVKAMDQSVSQAMERCLVASPLSPVLRKEIEEKIRAYVFKESQATLSKIPDELWKEFRALRTKQSLKQGHIHQVQERLKAAGFDPGPIDGVLGSQTRTALTQYQIEKGLPVTGKLDQGTLKALGLE